MRKFLQQLVSEMAQAGYDCIVAGGGHAGCEAALAMARLGLKILLVSGNLDRLGYLSCNPAIGGLAKGHLVREIDALGGQMGLWADAAGIQFRTLNQSRGPAVRATRAQMDRDVYSAQVKKSLYTQPNIDLWQDNVTEIIETGGRVCGVKTSIGRVIKARHVLLTPGTFLNGKIFIGMRSMAAGRMGDGPALGLSESLKKFGFNPGRLKTGTTPRILRSSIDFTRLEEQFGHSPRPRFSFLPSEDELPQTSCHITWTNIRTHEIIRDNLDKSPLFQGLISGVGARYCPSIEDKVARFPQRNRHQIFLEPEGLHSGEVYCNGISTSLPLEVQELMIHSITGLEKAVLVRPGYAIEYDYVNPLELHATLETRKLPGLWHAGQINGTSGYEEAAAQGLWAALNIYAVERDLEPFLPGRDEAYMGVLIDDLVTEGTEEPYRMFTSRAEHRLLLREDNADSRLTPIGKKYGLVNEARWIRFLEKRRQCDDLIERLTQIRVSGPEMEGTLKNLLTRPEINLSDLKEAIFTSVRADASTQDMDPLDFAPEIGQFVESEIKYAGYLKRQAAMAQRSKRNDLIALPADLDFSSVCGLSVESIEKFIRFQPETIGSARRISGITPADISCLEIHLYKTGVLKRKMR